MKKSLLLYVMLVSLASYSQYSQTNDKSTYFYISYGADIKNAITGSNPTNNKPALDGMIEAHAVVENIDFGLGYEAFPAIVYSRKFVTLGYHINTGYIMGTNMKCSLIPAIEWSQIVRTHNVHYTLQDGTTSQQAITEGYSTPSLNLAFQLDLNKHFAVQIATNMLHRVDLKYIYNDDRIVFSNYFKIMYKF